MQITQLKLGRTMFVDLTVNKSQEIITGQEEIQASFWRLALKSAKILSFSASKHTAMQLKLTLDVCVCWVTLTERRGLSRQPPRLRACETFACDGFDLIFLWVFVCMYVCIFGLVIERVKMLLYVYIHVQIYIHTCCSICTYIHCIQVCLKLVHPRILSSLWMKRMQRKAKNSPL